jgi:long-chain acyl-CoA synthetase
LTSVGGQNLARLAEQAFERRGDYESLLFEDRWYRSGELFERSRRLGAGLAELGVRPGDRVVVTMANSPEVGIAYQAIWRAGAVVTPASFLLAAPDLRHVVADSEATAVITSPEFADKAREATNGVDAVKFVISSSDGEGLISLAALEQPEPAPIVLRDDDELAALLYTGGTTGRAKGVMLSHANLYFSGAAAHQAAFVQGINRGLVALPMSHAYGLLVTIAAMHAPEQALGVLMRWFEPRRFLTVIDEHRVQTSAVVPSMLQLLLSERLEDYDLSSLRFLSCGAAPLAPEVAQQFVRRVPSVSIRQGYGLTESAALISTNPTGRERPGSVGLPVPGTEVRILDDDGRELPPDAVGEICARSPGVMRGYWRAPEADAEALHGGWLHTGDLGYLDEDGYLFIVDRKKDLIIRGGFNVYPRDVEDALQEHPAIEAAGVVGRPEEIHGEEVIAFVSLRPGATATAEELIEWGRGRIGGYRYPREVFILDAMPLTNVGKLDRKALRGRLAPVAAGADRARPPSPPSAEPLSTP